MEEVIIQDKKSELNKLNIKDLFFKYVRFLPLFIISVALSLLTAYIYLRYSTPIYQSSGALMIQDDTKKSNAAGEKFDQVLAQSNAKNIQNEIEVLKSKPLMERVVSSSNLNVSYFAKGKIKELDVYHDAPFALEVFKLHDSSSTFNLAIDFVSSNVFRVNNEPKQFTFGQVFENGFGVFRLNKRAEAAKGSQYRVTYTSIYTEAAYLSSAIIIAPKNQGSSTVVLSLESTNPQFAADVINGLMDQYADYTLEQKNIANQQTKAFIDERVKVVAREIDSINNKRLAFMRENNLADVESQGSEYFTRASAADQVANEQRIKLDIAQSIDQYLLNAQMSHTPVPSPLTVVDPTVANMIAAYNVAQMERKSLTDGGTPEGNVLVKQKDEQIEKLRQNILESLRNVKSSISTTIQHVESEGSQAQSKIRALPAKQQVLEDIKRQQASKLALYNFLMEKREESELAIAANISSSKILDVAMPNAIPVKPSRRTVQLLAILIGIAIPALFIFALEMLNDKVTTRYDIERITEAPVLGEIGHSLSDSPLVVTHGNRSVVAEQFRIIRSNLQYVLNHVSKPVIMVTSSFSGEGKSFISTNVGAVMALAGKKTVILEFDIRKPKILSHLRMSKTPGITNYLLGKIELKDTFVAVPGQENLYVVSCGPVPPNPSELLLDQKIDDLFVYLKNNFDAIIIDTAPVGMVSDAMTLGKYADSTLYIVRQGHTFKRQIGLIDEYHQTNKLPRISIILNDVKLRAGYGYYGYGRYGYGYGYGSSYFQEDVPPPTLWQEWFGWMGFSKNGKKNKKKDLA